MAARVSIFQHLSLALAAVGILAYSVAGQPERYSQEVSEIDGQPVILKHLPENPRSRPVYISDNKALIAALGERPILAVVDFSGGTEAAAADYDAGRVLLIEYQNPQISVDADTNFVRFLADNPSPTVYRRIGNYSAFVFDVTDSESAIRLLDQIRYEKQVQWLGEDPYLMSKIERYFSLTGRDVVLSTILWIAMWAGIVIAVGTISGCLFFRYRERQRAGMTAFSDAGGMTRLNLDDLSEPLR